jgi:type IV pilus assembly protein PilV
MHIGMKLPQQKPQKGFSMLEVLIAILVISFGLLGLAGLQALGLKNNQTAYLRSLATQQAYDMADRMRANMKGVAAGSYNSIPAGAGSDPGCITSNCSTAQMATNDRYEWNSANAALLPGGAGSVYRANADCTTLDVTSNRFCIRIGWTDKCIAGESGCEANGTITRNFDVWVAP